MQSSLQEIAGINSSLNRLEKRIKAYREILLKMKLEEPYEADDSVQITEGEVQTIESLILRLARRITGTDPQEAEWETLHPYCSRNEEKKEKWVSQNYEYFRWALMWIEKTRTYVEYLEGMESATGKSQLTTSTVPGVSEESELPLYDVALSFAGEDRAHARKIAELLRSSELTVFYDEYEQASLWGRNLYTHLSDVYQNKARYCLMFISEHYAKKLWTKRERESAQARAFRESEEYILPLRLDDTTLPGIEDTVGYLDLRETTHEQVVQLLVTKFRR